MARVPTYGPRKVKATPVATANFRSNASPEAFGAGIGRAFQNVAGGLNDLGNSIQAVQDLDDAAIVDKQVNEYRDYARDRTYNPETGFVNQGGRDAVEGRTTYDKDINETRDRIGANLNPKQRELYNRKTQGRRDASLDTSIRHAANQRKKWYSEEHAATLNGITDDAIAMSTEAIKFEAQIKTGYAEIEKVGLLNGWTEDKLKAEQEQWRSGVHTKLIKGLAPKDPLQAHAWLSVYGKQMTNADRLNMENALAHPVRLRQADDNAQRILSGEDTDVPMEGNPDGKIKMLGNTRRRTAEEINNDGSAEEKIEGAPLDKKKQPAKTKVTAEKKTAKPAWDGKDVVQGITELASVLGPGVSVEDVATIMYFETAGTLNPTQKGPVTQHGRHRGYIQFGEPQAKQYGVDWKNPIKSQLGRNGAVAKYLFSRGFKPGMNIHQLYATINAGSPNKLNARDGHNGGTPGTVRDKVNKQMHGHRLKAKLLLGGNTQAPGYVEGRLAKIKDPKLREETSKAIGRQLAVSTKLARTRQRNAKLTAEKFLISQPNFNPTQLPLAVQQEIGIEGMTKLYNYQDLVEKHGDVKTDEELFLDLRRQQAEDPRGFAEDVDLFDHVDKLSVKDRRSLQQLQVNAKKKTASALEEGKSVSKAMSLATRQLKAAGVIRPSVRGQSAEAQKKYMKREVEFQRQLMQRMEEFQKTEKRVPTDNEVHELVDQLLTPIIITAPGMLWGTNDEDALLFDAPSRVDGSSIKLNVPYESIDVEVRLAIKTELAKTLGREPTKEEIKAEYVEFVLGE